LFRVGHAWKEWCLVVLALLKTVQVELVVKIQLANQPLHFLHILRTSQTEDFKHGENLLNRRQQILFYTRLAEKGQG